MYSSSIPTELKTAVHIAVTGTLHSALTSGTTGIVTGYGLGVPGFEHHSERYFSRLSGPAVRPDHSRVHWVTGFGGWGVTLTSALGTEIWGLGRDVDHPPPTNSEVKERV